jgi:hypothetical protein
MRQKSCLHITLGLMLMACFAARTEAAIITVPAGETILNYDFTTAGAVPAPPYDSVQFRMVPTSLDSSTSLSVLAWTGFNATGTSLPAISLSGFPVPPGTFTATAGSDDAGFVDGLFSLQFLITGPAATLNFTVTGIKDGVRTAEVDGVPIPEPGALMLLASGLAAALVRRLSRAS